MKKTIVVMSALIIGCATVKAQKISFGVKAGVQQNNLTLKQKESGEWTRANITGMGFHVGGIADISLNQQFSLQPQLLFNSKSIAMSSMQKINMFAIDIPVNFLYTHAGFFAGVGPNFSYGISAKSKMDGSDSQDMYKKYDEGGEDASQLKRFELGANLTMGYKFGNGVMISTNYAQGLSNISGYATSNNKFSTRQVGLSIGYILGSHAK